MCVCTCARVHAGCPCAKAAHCVCVRSCKCTCMRAGWRCATAALFSGVSCGIVLLVELAAANEGREQACLGSIICLHASVFKLGTGNATTCTFGVLALAVIDGGARHCHSCWLASSFLLALFPVRETHGSLSQCVSFSLIDVGSVLTAYDGSKVSQQQQQQQLLSPSSSVSEALQQQQHQQPVLTQRSASFSGGTVSKRPKPPLPAQQQHQHQQDDCSSNIPAAAAAHSDAASSGHCGTITDSPAQPYGAAPERPGGTQPFSLDPGGGLQDAREVASKAKGKLLGEGADQALASSQADAPDVGFFKATDSKHTRAEAAAASLPSGPVPPSPPAKHHHHKPHHHPPLCSSGMHVHGAMNAVNRLKGMRRRSARVLARIKAL
eukprot:1146796-Pelagomonas_calceolata.AAC.3